MLGKWGVQAASRGHFSDKGCIAVTSQAAGGQGISYVPPSVISYNTAYQTAEDKPKGYSVESGPECLGSMSVCGAAQWFKLTLILLTWRIWRAPNNASKWQMGFNSEFQGLSESCPKFKFFDFHKILKNLLDV